MRNILIILSLTFLFGTSPQPALSCTNLIITKGASNDGSVIITYAADSHTRDGAIAFYPATDNKPGSMCQVYHYESGKWMGEIPEVAHTYSVVQFMNEHQVAIGETTFGGLDSLQSQPGAFLDYGSLMKIGLQRAKSARELIRVITELIEQYGYASGGESFSVSDSREAWIMELIGKGKYEKGAVWVAMRIPDGYVSGHANQARITTFDFQKSNDWNDPQRTVYHSPDVINFAKAHGFYKGEDADFSFSDVYNPVNFGGARFCDSRVWSFFRKVNAQIRNNATFTDYAKGKLERSAKYPDGRSNAGNFVTNRLPLWVKVDSLVTLRMVMDAMRDHFEDTPLDMRYDFGAGPFQNPYRWRPMEFRVDGALYLNERAIATQQTGYSFVAQSRSWIPDPIGGIFWFGVDDADGCIYAPMYCGIQSVPVPFATGTGSMIRWSDQSAFWTFNQVNNFSYSRYNVIHPEIETYQRILENRLAKETAIVDYRAGLLYSDDPGLGIDYVTDYSWFTGNMIVSKWNEFYHYLFMKYMDGNVKQSQNMELLDNGNGRGIPKKPSQPGYGADWERRMVEGTGDRFRVIGE